MKKNEKLALIQREEEQYYALIEISQQLQKKVEARQIGDFSKRISTDIRNLKTLVKKCKKERQELEN